MIEIDSSEEWQAALDDVARYDFYHRPAYHRLAEARGGGRSILFSGRYEGIGAALPMVIRDVPPVPAPAKKNATGLADATSVYGYPGPIAANSELPVHAVRQFQAELHDAFRARRIVSAFSRIHPVIGAADLVTGMGEIRNEGPTVSIDLTLTEEAQRALYRSNHRRDLAKLARAGFSCRIGGSPTEIDAFTTLYLATMLRVGAADGYLFDRAYFERLLAIQGLMLMLCRDGSGEVCAGAILSVTGTICQYHLGATADNFLSVSPMKLVFDTASLWGREEGATILHLGGGLGAREDALFNFKAGFSPRRHMFQTWRWIVDAEAYHSLECDRETVPGTSAPEGFFPAYRA